MADQTQTLDIDIIEVPKGFPWGGSRDGTIIDTIVLHYTDGKNDDPQRVADTWIKPTADAAADQEWGREASAHYINPRDGKVTRFMPEFWEAWHTPGCNKNSIGIENCAYKGEALTPDQEIRLIALINDILSRNPTIKRITGHRFATPGREGSTDCPGSLFGAPPYVSIEDQKAALVAWVAKNFDPKFTGGV